MRDPGVLGPGDGPGVRGVSDGAGAGPGDFGDGPGAGPGAGLVVHFDPKSGHATFE